METSVRRLRKIIREIVGGVSQLHGVRVGDWYRIDKRPGSAGVAKLLAIEPYTTANGDTILMAVFKDAADGTSKQRFDAWRDRVTGPASSEDVRSTEEAWMSKLDRMRRSIDTSREGT